MGKSLTNKIQEEVIKAIIKEARLLSDGRDNKFFLPYYKFELILDTVLKNIDGRILKLNTQELGGNYVHELFYKRIRYVAVTKNKIILNEDKSGIVNAQIVKSDDIKRPYAKAA